MFFNEFLRKLACLFSIISLIFVFSNITLAQETKPKKKKTDVASNKKPKEKDSSDKHLTKGKGELISKGKVTVNGQSVNISSTVFSGSKIVTGENAGTTINLGSIGKVKTIPNSVIMLEFGDKDIIVTLLKGGAKIISASGINAKIVTQNAEVIADYNQANSFRVDVGCEDDAECVETVAEVFSGLTLLSSKKKNQTQTINANEQKSTGPISNSCKKMCFAPITTSTKGASIGLMSLIGGGIVAAILGFVASQNDDNSPDGTTLPVSPIA